jgi:predicted transcriptional regulator
MAATLRLSSELKARLEAVASRLGISQAGAISIAVGRFLDMEERAHAEMQRTIRECKADYVAFEAAEKQRTRGDRGARDKKRGK